MKVVLVGCGGIAASSHMPAMARYAAMNPDFLLAACCDADAERAEGLGMRFGIPHRYSDIDAMIRAEKPDAAVCLVSETQNHIVGGHLMERGIPTLLEKPPGRTGEEYAYLLDKQKSSGTPLMIAFNRRFMPVYQRALASLGTEPLRYIDYTMYRLHRHESYFETTAIHAMDAVRYLAGGVYRRLELRYQPLPWHGEGVTNIYMHGEMDSGVHVTIRILVSTGDIREGFEAHTDTRIIEARTCFPGSPAYAAVYENGVKTLLYQESDSADEAFASNGFYREHEMFYDCLRTGAAMPCVLEDVGQSVALCGAIKSRASMFQG